MMRLSDRMFRSNILHLPSAVMLLMTGTFLSSCADMSEGDRMRRDDAAIGVAIGAIGGYVVCKDGNKAACAAGGAVVGGGAGYVIGDQGAKRIDQMDHGSDYRERSTCDIKQQIAEIADYNYELRRQVDQYEQDISKNLDRRSSVLESLRRAQSEYDKLVSVLVRERQNAARMFSQNRAYAKQVRLLEEHIRDLDLSIRRLKKLGGSYSPGGGW